MILTVTPNTALDHVLEVEHFAPGERLKVLAERECIGGKGNLVSAFAVALGAESVSLGFAAGASGRRLASLVRARGAEPDFTWAEGETRRITVVVDRRRGIQTWLVRETMRVTRAQVKQLVFRVERWLPRASWLALCGSLPTGCPGDLYLRLAKMARARGVRVLVDSRGAALLGAIQGSPEVIKLNLEELEETLGEPGKRSRKPSDAASVDPAVFQRHGLELVICTMGEQGAIAAVPGNAWHCKPPRIRPLSSAGSGDAFTAALLVRTEKGDGWKECLRWATAAGSAKAMESRTDWFRIENVKRFRQAARILPLLKSPLTRKARNAR
jgi:tagatose 6-phosphate kinase